MRKYILNTIRFGIGVLILFLLFYKIGFLKIYNTLKIINPWFLIPIFFFFLLSWIISTLNIKILLKPLGYKISFWKLFRFFWISKTVTLIVPGRIGDFSIIAFLKDKKYNIGKLSAVVFTDKVLTLFFSFLFAIIGFIIFFDWSLVLKVVVSFALITIIFFLLLTKKSKNFIKKYILRRYAVHMSGFTGTFYDYFKKYKKFVLIDMFWTVIRILANVISEFFMFLALGNIVGIFFLIIIESIETIIGMLPITPEGIGIKQSLGVYLFGLIGIASPIVAARYVIGLLEKYFCGLLSILFVKKFR